MPITVTLSPQVPDDVQVLGVPVYAGRRQLDKAVAALDVGYLAERGYLDEELEPDYPREYRDYPEYPDELAATEYGPPAQSYPEDAPGTRSGAGRRPTCAS